MLMAEHTFQVWLPSAIQILSIPKTSVFYYGMLSQFNLVALQFPDIPKLLKFRPSSCKATSSPPYFNVRRHYDISERVPPASHSSANVWPTHSSLIAFACVLLDLKSSEVSCSSLNLSIIYRSAPVGVPE